MLLEDAEVGVLALLAAVRVREEHAHAEVRRPPLDALGDLGEVGVAHVGSDVADHGADAQAQLTPGVARHETERFDRRPDAVRLLGRDLVGVIQVVRDRADGDTGVRGDLANPDPGHPHAFPAQRCALNRTVQQVGMPHAGASERFNVRLSEPPRSARGAMMLERWKRLLEEDIRQSCEQMMREPAGILTHPYTVPSTPDSPYYSSALWDWDSWFISAVLGQVEADTDRKGHFFAYEEGCILNFLDHTDADGVMPIQLKPEGPLTHRDAGRAGDFSENMHKPVLAQHAAMIAQRRGDVEWMQAHIDTLGLFLQRYLESHVHEETGLAFWQTDFAVGVDNDPSVYYRPEKSTASIYLNCLLYRELLAYGYLLEESGRQVEANRWRGRAQNLADAVNT